MQHQALVAVERNADWSDWNALTRSLPDIVMVVQEPAEKCCEFHARLLRCVHGVQVEQGRSLQVILLRCAARGLREPLSELLVAQLADNADVALQVYPRDLTA
jgi:hypothetical protein